MTNRYKHILLYTFFILTLCTIFYIIDESTKTKISLEKKILIDQARTHFQNQSDIRLWNDQYLGVYVLAQKHIEPHPLLPNNTITSTENEKLIRVNHSSMTRELSEISHQDNFKFHLTSPEPLNKKNIANSFEKRAFKRIEQNGSLEYFEFGSQEFRYLGAILTQEACLSCHAHQGYKVGDIRGGLSVTLEASHYNNEVADIRERSLFLYALTSILLSLITYFGSRELRHSDLLKQKVEKRTKEINKTKELLQTVLDSDASLMLVASGIVPILANKTLLTFLNIESLEEFRKSHRYISDLFIYVDDTAYLNPTMPDEHWISYLDRKQHKKDIKVLIAKDGHARHLKVHVKEITLNEQNIHIIVFDDITEQLIEMKKLRSQAMQDPLTKLYNRAKFNEILLHEIELSKTTLLSFSLIFLDIDHFKAVNDNYGHDVGDKVLIALSDILTSLMRSRDFVARWGGEEFIITLQGTTIKDAASVAEKLREKVQEYDFPTAHKLTISLGVTEYIRGETVEEFIKRADEALYEAKNSGRDRVVLKA